VVGAGSFAFADIVLIKALGLGVAIAVAGVDFFLFAKISPLAALIV